MNTKQAFASRSFRTALKFGPNLARSVGAEMPKVIGGNIGHLGSQFARAGGADIASALGPAGARWHPELRRWIKPGESFSYPPTMYRPGELPHAHVPTYAGESQTGKLRLPTLNPVGNATQNAVNRANIQFPYGLPLKQAAVFTVAFGRRLNELTKEASAKRAGAVAGDAARVGAKELFGGFKNMFSRGAHDAERGIFGPGLSGAPGAMGHAERLGFSLGNTGPGAWAHQNPGMAGAIGAGLGGMGLQKGLGMYADHRKQEAVANAPFGNRLALALQYLVSPEAVSRRLY